MLTELQKCIMHLSLIESIGPVHGALVCDLLKTVSVDELYRYTISDFLQKGFTDRIAHVLVTGLRDQALLDRECSLIEKYGAKITTIHDIDYPFLLKQTYAPPLVLYCQGGLPAENLCAIVGSRQCSDYGKTVAEYLVQELVVHDISIISGGARGIDAIAHRQAILSKGKTIVVTGAGLLHPYPSEHAHLFDQVIESGGCVMSIFSMDTKPVSGNFPARNRIIAGLSTACVVVQAAEKSGALITANYALDQGRSVFVVPGSIFEKTQYGCHRLAQQGATLVSHVNDILEVYHKQSNTDVGCGQSQFVKSDPLKELTLVEKQIIALCMDSPQSIECLMQKTGIALFEMQNVLFSLQLLDCVMQLPNGLWKAS